ncbi:MAG: glycosyl hydrolase [Terracidiphilus sp.]
MTAGKSEPQPSMALPGGAPRRKSAWRLLLAALLCMGAAWTALAQAPDAHPVDPDATPAARALLHDLDTFSGHATIGGQHNYPYTISRYSDRVYDLTGEFPALFGQDFGFAGGDDKDSTLARPSIVAEAIRQYRSGAVIALTWHAVRPTDDEPVTFRDSVQGHLTDWEWRQLLTPGTDLYNRWCRQVDRIAGYLMELQDAGVPVLFRPYHEMNGNWFWWGGRPGPDGSAALYRQLFDRYVHTDRLHNLIWVWNVNSPNGVSAGPVGDYLPGAAYADVLTMDVYEPFRADFYNSMIALAGPLHKPIALAEVGTMPSLEMLAQQPRWAYFMMWSELTEELNPVDRLRTVLHAPNIVNRGDARLSKPFPAPAAPSAPADPETGAEVRALLAKLADAKGKGVLAGQRIAGSGATTLAETQTVLAATGKLPAIVEIDVSAATDAIALLAEVRKAAGQGELALLRWLPPSPAGDPAAGALSDFEWQQLLQPGTDLFNRWTKQADQAAALLRPLADAHLAVLWSPYPDSNAAAAPIGFPPSGGAQKSSANWWAGRPGLDGSRELYSRLFERLTTYDRLHNLAWVWEAAPPGFNPGANNGFEAYFPGPLHMDAMLLDAPSLDGQSFPLDRLADRFAGGKPYGVRVGAGVPSADALATETGWRWMTLSSPAADSDAIRGFYADEHVLAAGRN